MPGPGRATAARHAYPLMLDVTDRMVVIVGGGSVAARKAEGLIEAGATRLRVVAPERSAAFPEHPAIAQVAEPYRPDHLEGAGLAFAATDSADVNAAVVRDAQARGVLVCRADADDERPGDFVTPARFREGEVTVTVSAGSAALAVAIRNDLARRIDRRHLQMAHAMQALRPLVRDSHLPAQRRGAIFRDLAGEEALVVLADGGDAALHQWLRRKYPELNV